jgi:hypothetical protein
MMQLVTLGLVETAGDLHVRGAAREQTIHLLHVRRVPLKRLQLAAYAEGVPLIAQYLGNLGLNGRSFLG